MKKIFIILTGLLSAFSLEPSALGQGTAFTYQGRFNDGANLASGSYDLRLALFDAAGGGAQQGNAFTNAATAISNGLFTVTLDFGNQFPGANRWLEIGVRTNGGGVFATLSPRQLLTSTPYAVQAGNAATASSVAAVNVSGTLSTAQLPASIVTNGASDLLLSGAFIGNGSGLTNVPGTLPAQLVAGTNVLAQPNQAYNVTSTLPVTITLPTNANVGDVMEVNGVGSGGWQIQSAGGQIIRDHQAGLTWTPHGPVASWTCVASSADGAKLVAAAQDDQIYTSVDRGMTWTARPYTNFWEAVASSSDGSKLVALAQSGGKGGSGEIYTSTDSGATWIIRPISNSWVSVASSADGIKLVALTRGGQKGGGATLIYTSTDSGVTWIPGPISNIWASVASSADGAKLVAVTRNEQIYTSVDSGVTWTAHPYTNAWSSVASSADGTKLVAVPDVGPIYTSADGGMTWTAQSANDSWASVASSADGTKLVALTAAYQVYTSTDGGATWTVAGPISSLVSVASSADGTKLVAVTSGDQIYTSISLPVAGVQGSSVSMQYVGSGFWQLQSPLDSVSNLPNTTVLRDGSGAITATSFAGSGAGLTGVALLSSNNTFTGNQTVSSGNIYLDNAQGIWARNSAGNYEVFVWPRWSDDATYLNFGAGGFVIRNNLDVPAMFIQTNGNVGLGTMTPNYPLDFNSTVGDKISLYSSSPTNNYGFGIQSFQLQIHTDTSAADVVFGSGNSANFAETMRIRGNGNVGIGTAAPGRLLQLGSGASTTDALINLGCGNASAGRSWEVGVPYGTNNTSGDYYSFTIRDVGAGDRMVIRWDTGNVGFGTNTPQQKLHVIGNILASGTITGSSDRNVKQNFATIDSREVLEKVATLPISSWSYIADKDVRHLGPMAQDFYSAFNVGMDDKHISMVDADGVALAAIQGLNQKLTEELKRRDLENAELKARLEKLEQRMNSGANPRQ